MKLRLERDTVRLRLSPNEMELLKADKIVAEKISISSENEFSYSIQIDNHLNTCFIDFKNNSLKISVPNAIADKWMNSNQIGIKEMIMVENGKATNLIVEEDLPPRKK